ncbi:ankyrin repeat domain-containing protein [Kiloniella sp. b19]|uniref:ankyrin repeat domain-containing protein n=1 Tax=Kiloniella sp. GXU_MW_B19 TaxID=3141326 RepID=UPI0031D5133B
MHRSLFNFGSVAFVAALSLALLFAPARADNFEEGQKAFEEEAYEAAFRLWLVSADQGHGPSQLALAELYVNGLGVPRDAIIAYLYATLAERDGLNDASSLVEELEQGLDEAELKLARKLVSDWKPATPERNGGEEEVKGQLLASWFQAIENGEFEAVRKMVEDEFPVDRLDQDGWTGLQLAALLGMPKTVGMLVEAGAEVNHRDPLGMTPLMAAALSGSERIVKRLIAAGADIDAEDNAGETAAYMAEQAEHLRLARYLATAELPREQIRETQELLIQANYLSGEADGVAGKNTRKAVRTYQKAMGLKETGLIRQALLKSLRLRKDPESDQTIEDKELSEQLSE